MVMVFLLAVIQDAYLWFIFVKGGKPIWNILWWVPTAVMFVLPFMSYISLFIALGLIVVVPKLILTICSLLGRLVGLALPGTVGVMNVAGMVLAVIAVVAIVYGMTLGWRHLVVRDVDIVSPDIPDGFDGYRIVQLSDLHIGTFLRSPGTVDEIVELVNARKPDLIVFTGDLVNVNADEVDGFVAALSRLNARDGVVSILGNHDYCEYRAYVAPDSPAKSLLHVVRKEKEMGWNLLRNEHVILHRGGDSIALIGVENQGQPPFPQRADLPKSMEGLGDGMYKILLSHDPTHWRAEVLPNTDINLTLSGHTHAMQLKIGGFSPSKWKYREWGGLYSEGSRLLHVSTGTGSNVPFRLGAWPEIDVLTLRKR